jgi:hypothetical protein
MPCASVHLMLAGRVLRAWEQSPSTAPVSLRDPEHRAAFLGGALAPDAGFTPTTDRRFSEFSHYVAPGDLSRALLERARTEAEAAFAWGWATHVLGDVELHPVVGRAVGEFLHGDPEFRVNASEDVETHVSLEVGLDLQVLEAEGPALPVAPVRAWSGAGEGGRFLVGALEATYGVPWGPGGVLRDQRRSAWMMRSWPGALSLVSRSGDGSALGRLLGFSWHRAAAGTPLRGLLGPRRPPPWVLDQVMESAEGFAARFQAVAESGLVALGNRNLETGDETLPGQGHPATDAAWKALERAKEEAGAR